MDEEEPQAAASPRKPSRAKSEGAGPDAVRAMRAAATDAPPPPNVEGVREALLHATEVKPGDVGAASEGDKPKRRKGKGGGNGGDDDGNGRPPDATAEILLRQFEQRDVGLFWFPPDSSKPKVHVCGPIAAIARTRDDHGENWGVLLTWKDNDGRQHEWPMPRAMLAGGGDGVREYLLSRGLYVAPDQVARQALMKWLSIVAPIDSARCVGQVGWHQGPAGLVFVLPDKVYGPADGERMILQSSGSVVHAFNEVGSVEDWRREVGSLCAGNTRLILAVAAAFAASLLHLAGDESGGINFQGASRIGKSTTLRVAGSVWGGGPQGYTRNWRATANGLESVAAAHSDALLALDELGQMDPREAGEIAYMLANGSGKARAGRDGGARHALYWRAMIVSTGETSLAELAQEGGRRAKAGQEVRIVDVPADAGGGLGLFEELHGSESADAFARRIKDAAGRCYGAPIRAYLAGLTERLARDKDGFSDWLAKRRTDFVARHVPEGATGQVLSVAGRFALIASGGELASALGVTGWDAGIADWAVALCFKEWLDRRGTVGAWEDETGLGQVRVFIEAHGSSRFENWEANHRDLAGEMKGEKIINRAGFKRANDAGAWEYFITPEIFKGEICKGLDARQVARVLVERGFLVPGGGGKFSRSLTVPGYGKLRLYHLRAEIMGDAGDGSDDGGKG